MSAIGGNEGSGTDVNVYIIDAISKLNANATDSDALRILNNNIPDNVSFEFVAGDDDNTAPKLIRKP